MTDEYVLMDDYRGRGDQLFHRKTGAPFRPVQGWATRPQEGQPGNRYAGGFFRGQIFRAAKNPEIKGLSYQMETDGEYVSLSEEMEGGVTQFALAMQHYRHGDGGHSYHYAWPHKLTESIGDLPDVRSQFQERLEKCLADVPFKFTLLGARRRYLLYFSPGSYNSQTTYLTLAPRPSKDSPFNEEGKLSSRYRDHFPPELVEQLKKEGKKITPMAWEALSPAPLLYRGPAWSIRFLLDDQDVLGDNRVWITDDMNFISSDWCQRHNYSTYNQGMDFHNQEFDLPNWITVALAKKAIRDRSFKPKAAGIKHFAVRDMMKANKQVVLGEFLKAARDCLLQLEWLGTYEIPTIYGMPFDPLLLSFKAPLGKNLMKGRDYAIEATMEAGMELEWCMANLDRTARPHSHLFGKDGSRPWSSHISWAHYGPKDLANYEGFFKQLTDEVRSYRESRLAAPLSVIVSRLWERGVVLGLYERYPKERPKPDGSWDLAQMWGLLFQSSKMPEGGAVAVPLAGIDERDIANGRQDVAPAVLVNEPRQAGVDEMDIEDDEDFENDDEGGDEEEVPFDEALAAQIDARRA